MKKIKLTFYYLAKYIGVFAITKYITRKKLRILCYHGVSLANEHLIFDKLFITHEVFKQRMTHLLQAEIPIISLEDAIDQLENDNLRDNSTVITFDDGWSGVYSKTADYLEEIEFPWTIYVTSYYMQKQTQVFNIVFQYILAMTQAEAVDLSDNDLLKDIKQPISNKMQKDTFYDLVTEIAIKQMDAIQRQALLSELANKLTVDIEWILEQGCFKNFSSEQCKELAERGVDIQLHTHRHTFPSNDLNKAKKEILENKAILEKITGKQLAHFCYPSGVYDKIQFPLLEEIGIKSATTVFCGLNGSNNHRYELLRFLDGQNIKQIEFEAEVSGFSELLRKVFRR